MAESRTSHPTKASSPAFSFTGRPETVCKDRSPGPAKYDSPPRSAEMSRTFGHGKRQGFYNENPVRVPGPGSYESNKNTIRYESPPNYSMGKIPKRPNQNGMPGPGNYHPGSSHTQSSPRFSFGVKIPPRTADPGPGPGAHEFKDSTIIKSKAPMG